MTAVLPLLLACAPSIDEADPAAATWPGPLETGDGPREGMVRVPGAIVGLGDRKPPPPGSPPGGGGGWGGGTAGPDQAQYQQRLAGPQDQGQAYRDAEIVCAEAQVLADTCPLTGARGPQWQRVRVADFWMDLREVTRAAYREFLGATGYRPPHVDEPWAEDGFNWDGLDFPEGTGDHPVVMANWYDAREYCRWRGARLPTEAEWQLAAHGPADAEWAYPWGKAYEEGRMNRGRLASPNYDATDGWLTTSPVGAFPGGRSRVGADDLFGNAWEWVADVRVSGWSQYLWDDEARRLGPHTGTLALNAATRGHSYFGDPRPSNGESNMAFVIELRRKTAGFRCAMDAD